MDVIDISDGFWDFIDVFGSTTESIISHPMYNKIKHATLNNNQLRISSYSIGTTDASHACDDAYYVFEDIQALFAGVIAKLEEYINGCGTRCDLWSTEQTVKYYIVTHRLARINAAIDKIENTDQVDWISANFDTMSF